MARMTVGLIEALQDIAEQHGEDVEVRIAVQPNWPFEHSIDEVACTEDVDDDGNELEPVAYIGEGAQLGYLPGDAAQALGWR